jgi:hypothetical protein
VSTYTVEEPAVATLDAAAPSLWLALSSPR